jgi:hypothetical protein
MIYKQARQAYLIGNKALAKELSAKGQLHNMHMKEAHGKAQESIYRQRFAVPHCYPLFLSNGLLIKTKTVSCYNENIYFSTLLKPV